MPQSVSFGIENDTIKRVEIYKTQVQMATVKWGMCDYSATISAAYSNGALHCEYRRPLIEDSPFQGQIAADEQRPMLLQVDDSEPLEIPVTNGIAEVPLEFESPGVYQLRITADFPCESAELEVVV